MKKIIYSLAAVTLFAVGCAKEQPIENKVEDLTPTNGKVTLTATMPNFIDDATKATIDESNGDFSWETTDRILVHYYKESDHSVTKDFTFKCKNPSTGLFESEEDITEGYVIASDAAVVAEYPVRNKEYDYWYDYRTYADNPGKSFIMEATVDAEGKLAFEHKSALVKLTINNVPSFTNRIYVGAASQLTQLEYLSFSSNQPSLTYYIPIRPTTTDEKMKIKVWADAGETIIEKTTHNAKPIQAGHFYVLPELNIGPVLTFHGTGLSSISKVKCTQHIGDSYGSNNVTWSLTDQPSFKYVVLPYASTGYYDWLEEGVDAVRVDVYDNDNNYKGFTEYVYVRNIDFEIASGEEGLKAEYRIYPYGTTTANHLYATYATGTYSTPTNITFEVSENNSWSEFSGDDWYWYSSGLSNNWPGNKFSKGGSFTIASASIVDTPITLVINNGNSGGTNQTNDLNITVTSNVSKVSVVLGDYDGTYGHRAISSSISEYADEILQYPLGALPGKAISIPASKSTYVTIPASYAGKILQMSFNDGTNVVRTWPNVAITRDYEYSF